MFHLLGSSQIEDALANTTRQYLVGDLSRPQTLPHIKDSVLDIGISNYPEDTVEPLHVHSVAREYQLVLSGYTEYFNPESHEVYAFDAGDFFVIDPHTPYIQKAYKGTRILFVKSSTINDKTCLENDEAVEEWLAEGFPDRGENRLEPL